MRIAVGLSGGVDSAIGGLILRDQGHEVVGVHLYCWPPKSEYLVSSSKYSGDEEREVLRRAWIKKNGCRADEDEQMALKTALELGIKFVKLDFSEEYNRRVVDYFYAEYEVGRTPNPDVLCNSEIKFGLFLDWALKNNFDYIATGHYAKTKCHGDTVTLMIPKDKHKDQTYFLWKLTEKELKHVLFPLGDYLKSEVREIALKNNLTVAKRKDSQGICFIGNVEAREFLSRRLRKKTGIVRNKRGEIIGEHDGVWFYTIGQRGGWGMAPEAHKKLVTKYQGNKVTPIFYVISKDAKKNELVVGVGKEAESNQFSIFNFQFSNNFQNSNIKNVLVRIRHGGELIPAEVGVQGTEIRVILEKDVRGIAPGQSAVFYREQCSENRDQREIVMLGGGVIA